MTAIDIFSRAKEVQKEKGFISLLSHTLGFTYRKTVRRALPDYNNNEMITSKDGEEKLFDSLLPDHFHNSGDRTYELGMQLAHKILTKNGDDVVVVGGGLGLSAVIAAEKAGDNGQITIFDAQDRHNTMHHNLVCNNVRDRCDIKQAIVLSSDDIIDKISEKYGINEEVTIIHPTELPECNVLDLDVEGSELDILKSMKIRPRVIIVELEAYAYQWLYDGQHHPKEVLSQLEEMGYKIIHQTGHRKPEPLTSKELLTHINSLYEQGRDGIMEMTETGARHSPVIYAVREDSVGFSKLDLE